MAATVTDKTLRKGTSLDLRLFSPLSADDFERNEPELLDLWFDAFELKLEEDDDESSELELELVLECLQWRALLLLWV